MPFWMFVLVFYNSNQYNSSLNTQIIFFISNKELTSSNICLLLPQNIRHRVGLSMNFLVWLFLVFPLYGLPACAVTAFLYHTITWEFRVRVKIVQPMRPPHVCRQQGCVLLGLASGHSPHINESWNSALITDSDIFDSFKERIFRLISFIYDQSTQEPLLPNWRIMNWKLERVTILQASRSPWGGRK